MNRSLARYVIYLSREPDSLTRVVYQADGKCFYMDLKVLGVSGGVADARSTTSFLLNDDILLDGGTGVCTLTLEQMLKIDKVFITHAHLDHIVGVSLMLATVIGHRTTPVKLYASSDVLEVLKTHIFNWQVWPDFSKLPDANSPILEFVPIDPGKPIAIDEHLIAESIPLTHTVPSYAFLIRAEENSLCICGDTGTTDQLWARLNAVGGVDKLFIELTYPIEKQEMAEVSGHYSVGTLSDDLDKMEKPRDIYLMHHKPPAGKSIREQVAEHPMSQRYNLLFVDEGMSISVL